ncbi:MAG: dicarboxylate/amino acid:cation symporter [Pirellulales bacterium]
MPRLALHWQILIAMALGAGGGLLINFVAGRRVLPAAVEIPGGDVQPYGFASPVRVQPGTYWSSDRPDEILMQIVQIRNGAVSARRVLVGVLDEVAEGRPPGRQLEDVAEWPPLAASPPGQPVEIVQPTLDELKKVDPEAYVLFLRHGRSTARIAADRLKMVGDLFLRLLKMVSIPLIVFSITSGVMGLGGAERLGKMFGGTLAYYLCTSMLAIATGMLMVNLIQPGVDGRAQAEVADAPVEQGKQLSTILFEQLENMIPPNPVAAITDGQFLGIITYSLAFAIFALLVGGKPAETVRDFATAGFEVMMRMTMAVIKLAPLGVLCLMFFAAATQGVSVFGKLGIYMLTVALALSFHAAITLPLIVKFLAKRSPWQFAQAMSPALLTAFSSASSNATLPLTLANVEQRAGVSNRISSFVLPLGATVNMDGTALYELVAVLFIANMTPGVDLSLSQQLIVAYTALLASIGAAGIPHAGLVMMVIILQAVGLPTESQGLIIAVDRVLDMARTCVNVWSDACGCAVIARFHETPQN